MSFALSPGQITELEGCARGDKLHYVRLKALALLSCAEGRAQSEVAGIFRVNRNSVANWCRRYRMEGVAGLRVKTGRGRRPCADAEELARHVLQSPRNFGIARTRWTLELLARTVPCLKGFTRYGVQQALKRGGFSYKRGQPSIHSPEPEYSQKKGLWTRL